MQSITDSYLEYDFLEQSLNELERNETTKGNIYEKIMAKEENVLNLMNRVAEEKTKKTSYDTSFLNKSVSELSRSTIATWMKMYNDIVLTRNYDVVSVFYIGERKIYTGIFLVIIALLLFFVEVND
jgi:hypothetical protein